MPNFGGKIVILFIYIITLIEPLAGPVEAIGLGFYKVTKNGNKGHEKVCIYNNGCNFNCIGCAYKIPSIGISRSDMKVEITAQQIMNALASTGTKRVHFIGGEPLTNNNLPKVAEYAHEVLGATTVIGHSNGSVRVPEYIDEASISIKAIDCGIHREYTGNPNDGVLTNFKDAYDRGVKLKASTVLIPSLVTVEEVERIAEYIAWIDKEIPFHITAYMPVPGVNLRAPSNYELNAASSAARKHLRNVVSAALDADSFAAMKRNDPSFVSQTVSAVQAKA